MDKTPTRTVALMIAWIETHLDEGLTLEVIAARAGYSPFHFSRLFLAETRRSVMAHVRARRLLKGARRLLSEPGLTLLDLAFDCGFESQEAFTRAFRRLFGTTPARFRAGFAVDPIEGQYPMSTPTAVETAVRRLPDLVPLPSFTLAGPARRFDEGNKAEIPQLWSRLVGALPFEGQAESWASYGTVSAVDRAEGSFRYLAGVEIRPGAEPPAGFETLTLPAAAYVVFRITLDGGPVHLQIKAAMREIWGELIPDSGLDLAGSPDFERYDGRIPLSEPGATLDFYVPVRA
ncbi:AraC family transcriptional regulator [Aureimonas endophytica]|uniref:AraC family transcriptional regulator n=1 Tax=Aureimonas endophytica TaxID=2027858 RepID=A0A917EB61_9HYPH|nr:AraC family transcriptional regulator [Aureimonas endophytica]GGE19502.1 AraC family transcriptional regulator [Aureimonas endophytica]